MKTYRVEWIGAASPQADDRVVYRKLMGLYTQEQQDLLDQATKKIIPLIRQDGTTQRVLSERAGFSRRYVFGFRRGTFVQEMTEEDVKHLFSERYPDGPEFKNLDDPAHADRVPIVPWAYIDKIIYDILREASTGPIIRLSPTGVFSSPKELISEYEKGFDVERAEHIRKRRSQKK